MDESAARDAFDIGRFLRHGKSVSHLRAELLDEHNELVAFATSTWKSLRAAKTSR